jgi:cell division septum initiation protein DivIVA
MDILHLIDRLEEVLNQSRPLPFTHNVIVDEDRILDLIDQMRMAIPDEVKKSQQVLVQKDRLLAQAQEEANRTLSIAREKSEQLLERDAIVQAAHERAKQILAEAKSAGEITQQDADEYVMETLRKLEFELERSISQVRNGIMVLQNERKTTNSVDQPQLSPE